MDEAAARGVGGNARVVLVVDDDDDLRGVLAQIIALEGHAVATAADGAQALAWLATHPPPALIVLDLVMPVVDGWEVLRRLRADPALASIPVVVHTALRDAARVATPGVGAVLAKPTSLDALLALVARYCDGRAAP